MFKNVGSGIICINGEFKINVYAFEANIADKITPKINFSSNSM